MKGRRQVLFVAILLSVASLVAPATTAQDESLQAMVPTDPSGAWGSVAIDATGKVHVAWSACPQGGPGCHDLWMRSREGNAWTTPQRIYDGPENAAQVRLYPASEGIHALWAESSPDDRTKVMHCFVVSGGTTCSATTVLGQQDRTSGNLAGSLGSAGHFRAVWQEEARPGESRIVMREWRQATWGPPVYFATGSVNQLNPALATGSNGQTHVAWEERPANQHDLAHEVRYALVPAGQATPQAIQTVSHIEVLRQRIALAELPGGGVAVAYASPREVYFREKSPGASEWSEPLGLDRSGRYVTPWTLQMMVEPSGAIDVLWTMGSATFQVVHVRREEGFWLASRNVLPTSYTTRIFDTTAARGLDGTLHVAWTGLSPLATTNALHYFGELPSQSPATLPEAVPVLRIDAPADGVWTKSAEVHVSGHIFAASPVTLEGVQLTVDGQPVPTTLYADGRLAGIISNIPEGMRQMHLQVTDSRGRQAEAAWSFGVDRQPPGLSLLATTGGQTAQDGWHRQPIEFRVAADPGSGAPARVQLSLDRSGIWKNLDDPGLPTWIKVEGQRVQLTEGLKPVLRFRAIDDAGNTALGNEHSMGWDATPPEIGVPDVAWVHAGGTLVVTDLAPPGSPVHLKATFATPGDAQVISTSEGDLAVGIPVPQLPEGAYTVSILAVDQAGNEASVILPLNVDSSSPILQLVGNLALARDAGSGIAHLKAWKGDQLLKEAHPDPLGNASIDLSAVVGVTRVAATDHAGNEAVLDFRAAGDPISVQESAASPDKGAPALQVGCVLLALLLGGVWRRRQRNP